MNWKFLIIIPFHYVRLNMFSAKISDSFGNHFLCF